MRSTQTQKMSMVSGVRLNPFVLEWSPGESFHGRHQASVPSPSSRLQTQLRPHLLRLLLTP